MSELFGSYIAELPAVQLLAKQSELSGGLHPCAEQRNGLTSEINTRVAIFEWGKTASVCLKE